MYSLYQIRLATTNNNELNGTASVSVASTSMTQQNVGFHDATSSWDYNINSNMDSTFDYGVTENVTLQQFMSRPIKVLSGVWSIGQALFSTTTFNPWTLFFTNKRVINRINNYNLLQCKLKVKILVNGTPFHYGKALMSYQPLHTVDTVSKLTRATVVYNDFIELTQRPHVYIDPTMDQGATMSLPFFWYKNWLNIVDSEWTNMGQMRLDIMVPLRHANGGTGDVSYSIYVWAEDVKLSAPTTMNSNSLVTQSGDEIGKGIISKTASNIAHAMGKLQEVPIIGPYAKATSLVSSSVADISRAYGYSRPPILDAIKPVRPTTYGNVANTDADDFSQKLSLDSKNELTIDSRTLGLSGNDEMTIKSIATRQCYYTQFEWLTTREQETMLFNTYVTPMLYATNSTVELHMTASCFAAIPFKYWTGSMKYRFQIVASPYHKGRLKIVYDPGTITTTTSEYNIAFTRIVDISKERDFELTVTWAQESAFKEVELISTGYVPFSTSTQLPVARTYNNGVLAVYVVNELTAPAVDPTDVTIIVSSSAGDDIEFAVPTQRTLASYSYFPTPPLTVQSGEVGEMCDDCPGQAEELDSYSIPSQPNHLFDVYMGEKIVSFRSLIKRYTRHYTYSVALGAVTARYFRVFHPNYPLYYGPSPTGIHTFNDVPWNICHTSFLTWLAPAFQAIRGGIRYKLLRLTDSKFDEDALSVNRTTTENATFTLSTDVFNITNQTDIAAVGRVAEPSMIAGASINTCDNGTTLEYELPYYSQYRFTGTKNITSSVNTIGYGQFCHTLTGRIKNGAVYQFHTLCYAGGEDLSLYFYTGPPILYTQLVLEV